MRTTGRSSTQEHARAKAPLARQADDCRLLLHVRVEATLGSALAALDVLDHRLSRLARQPDAFGFGLVGSSMLPACMPCLLGATSSARDGLCHMWSDGRVADGYC